MQLKHKKHSKLALAKTSIKLQELLFSCLLQHLPRKCSRPILTISQPTYSLEQRHAQCTSIHSRPTSLTYHHPTLQYYLYTAISVWFKLQKFLKFQFQFSLQFFSFSSVSVIAYFSVTVSVFHIFQFQLYFSLSFSTVFHRIWLCWK